MNNLLFNYDEKFIYCWEMVDGRPLTAIVLKITKDTGQLLSRPIAGTCVQHIGIILGKSVAPHGDFYVCSYTTTGIEITPLCKFIGPNGTISYMSRDESIAPLAVLMRLKKFFKNPEMNYCISTKNCYWFVYKIVYDKEAFKKFRNSLFVVVLLIILLLVLDG